MASIYNGLNHIDAAVVDMFACDPEFVNKSETRKKYGHASFLELLLSGNKENAAKFKMEQREKLAGLYVKDEELRERLTREYRAFKELKNPGPHFSKLNFAEQGMVMVFALHPKFVDKKEFKVAYGVSLSGMYKLPELRQLQIEKAQKEKFAERISSDSDFKAELVAEFSKFRSKGKSWLGISQKPKGGDIGIQ